MKNNDFIIKKLKCINCGSNGTLKYHSLILVCSKCAFEYKVFNEVPVLLLPISDSIIIHSTERKKAAKRHWKTGSLISYLPRENNLLGLNVGAGNNGDKIFLEQLGYKIISIDITYHEKTDFICDAHRLPFIDNSFDFACSLSNIEHLKKPWIFFEEINRIIKPNGLFIGSYAFLEPFHGNSYYHLSPNAFIELAKENNFEIIEIGFGWDVFTANLISVFPPLRLIRYLIEYCFKIIVYITANMKILLKNKDKILLINGSQFSIYNYELLKHAGSITFKLKKKQS